MSNVDTPRAQQSSPRRAKPIPPRQRLIGFAIILAVSIVLGIIVNLVRADAPMPAPGTTATPTPTPTFTIPEIARKQVYTSDMPSSGEYVANTITAKPALAATKTNQYRVQVETSVKLNADEVARKIQATLDDPRGWASYGKNNFELVTAEGDGVLTFYLVSPGTAQKLCQPADIEKKWNCRVGNKVVLNSDRWMYMTPIYDDIEEYRSYMINHEVGHYIGQGHVSCPKKGGLAPVMMQQSIDLGGCRPNAWPKTSD